VNSRSLLLYLSWIADRSACQKHFHRGQGALNLTLSLIDDLKITQLAFGPLCYLILFYNRTKIEVNFA